MKSLLVIKELPVSQVLLATFQNYLNQPRNRISPNLFAVIALLYPSKRENKLNRSKLNTRSPEPALQKTLVSITLNTLEGKKKLFKHFIINL